MEQWLVWEPLGTGVPLALYFSSPFFCTLVSDFCFCFLHSRKHSHREARLYVWLFTIKDELPPFLGSKPKHSREGLGQVCTFEGKSGRRSWHSRRCPAWHRARCHILRLRERGKKEERNRENVGEEKGKGSFCIISMLNWKDIHFYSWAKMPQAIYISCQFSFNFNNFSSFHSVWAIWQSVKTLTVY